MSSSGARPRGGTASRSDRAASPLRLTAPEHYRLAYREGTRISDELLVVYARPNGLAARRLGIAVPRRLGSAVRRNRLKRRVREASRTVAEMLPEGVDVVLIPRPTAADAPFAALQASARTLLNRASGAMR